MATLIASQAGAGVQPRGVHAGVNAVFAVYSVTATLTAADVIQMCKLPDGARVIDAILSSPSKVGGSDGKINVGSRDDPDELIASADASAVLSGQHINTTGGVGLVYDVSDDASVKYTMIEAVIAEATGSGTKSGAISLMITYHMDQ
jgi:hypothetical protein